MMLMLSNAESLKVSTGWVTGGWTGQSVSCLGSRESMSFIDVPTESARQELKLEREYLASSVPF